MGPKIGVRIRRRRKRKGCEQEDSLFPAPRGVSDMFYVISHSFHVRLALFRDEARIKINLKSRTQSAYPTLHITKNAPKMNESIETYHNNPIHRSPSLPPIHSQPLQHKIRNVPRDVPHASRTAMAPYHGRAGEVESLEGGGVRDVGDVDEHSEAVEFAD